MNKASADKKASDHLAVRTSGRPLFSYGDGDRNVEIFDLEQFRRDSGLGKEDVDRVIANLMIEGKAKSGELVFELHDGQALAQFL